MNKKMYKRIAVTSMAVSLLACGLTGCSEADNKPNETQSNISVEAGSDTSAETETVKFDYEKQIEDLYDKYNYGEMAYNEVSLQLNNLAKEHSELESAVREMKDKLAELKQSKAAYEKAVKCVDKKNYDLAAEYFAEVIEEDSNYSEAKVMLADVKKKYTEDLTGLVEACLENGDFEKVRDLIKKAEEYIPAEDIQTLNDALDKNQKQYEDDQAAKIEARKVETENAIAKFIADGDYVYAMQICEIPADDPLAAWFATKRYEIQDQWITNSIAEAENLLSQGRYDEAAGALNAAYYNVPDVSRLEAEIERIDSFRPVLLTSLTRFYDLQWKSGEVRLRYWESDDMDSTGAKGNKGLYAHTSDSEYNYCPESQDNYAVVEYLLNREYDVLNAKMLLSWEMKNTKNPQYMKVYSDGALIYTSPVFKGGEMPQDISIDVSKTTKLHIEFIIDRTIAYANYSVTGGLILQNPYLYKTYQPLSE